MANESNQKRKLTVENQVKSKKSFKDLVRLDKFFICITDNIFFILFQGITDVLYKICNKLSFITPTPIQEEVIPIALQGI